MAFEQHIVLARIVTRDMRAALAALMCAVCAQCQDRPVGVLEHGPAARWLRMGNKLFVSAAAGQMFHSGDLLRSESAAATVLYCPEGARYTLGPGAELEFGDERLRVRRGRIEKRENAEDCLLPSVARVYPAAEYHVGKSVFGTGTQKPLEDELREMEPARSAALRLSLAELDRKLAADPDNVPARLKRVALLERSGLAGQTLADLDYLGKTLKGATWAKAKAFVHSRRPPAPPGPAGPPGRTRALIVGISEYARRTNPKDRIEPLEFAHKDAELFDGFVRTPRGGAYQQIEVLVNAEATKARVRTAIDKLLLGAETNDRLLLFFSAHGTTEKDRGYLVVHDSFPGMLPTTAISMEYVAEQIRQALTRARQVIVYVDACRAGTLSLSGDPNQIHGLLNVLIRHDPRLLVFVACQPGQISVESKDYGGGHGAFSYFLHRALNGEGDIDRDQQITVQELVGKVVERVQAETPQRQLPSAFSGLGVPWVIAETWLPGSEVVVAAAPRRNPFGARDPLHAQSSSRSLLDEVRALDTRPAGQSALETLRVSTELENIGQAVLVRYLEGEQNPPQAADFAACAEAFERASRRLPESLWLEARRDFCKGRELVFVKDYAAAIPALEESIRLDPDGAYSYNALGIAYLETARYEQAVEAFQEAVRRAPYWAYAWNNLALAQTQRGWYDEALGAYGQARALNPGATYIAYNQALLLQLLNRRREAEAAYRALLKTHKDHAEAHVALGTLLAAGGRGREAESHFREALQWKPGLVSAGYNLALLVSRNRRRLEEAISLWRQVLAETPAHVPSRLGLAESLAGAHRWEEAAGEYEKILAADPSAAWVRQALEKVRRRLRK